MKRFSNNKFILGLAFLLITLGLVGVIPSVYYDLTHKGSVTTHALQSRPVIAHPDIPLITGEPVEISLPSVSIDIPVIPGFYNSNYKTWTLSLDKAQFATPTVYPNNLSGNTFIYGHYRVGVFYTLPHIQPGAKAAITTANGYQFTYTFKYTYATQPNDTSVLMYKGPPILTLQTCSGTFYQNRQMYVFSYDGYKKT
jgi:LPXTG-site transpeptidase (sortase) family protein